MTGNLYLVSTPIGNLQDISLRALEVLRSVDLIASEDTRHTGKLLAHFQIPGKLISCHEHNEERRAAELIAKLKEGKSIAVVSDAGTPGIADPGFRLVHAAAAQGIEVVPVPGPTAFVSAVVASGLPADAIFFGGFLPSRSGERRRRLEETKNIPATLVFYEAPHRLARSLADCLAVLGDRDAAVARELTKLHEEIVRGSLTSLADRFRDGAKGEIVLMIERSRGPEISLAADTSIAQRVGQLELEGLDRKAALKRAAKEFGLSRSDAYRRVEADKGRPSE